MHARVLPLLVALVALAAGCAAPAPAATTGGSGADDAPIPQNMTDLKERLGLAPPPPEPQPPTATAASNVTTSVTGSPIRFTAQGSRDPEGMPLSYTWTFSDGATLVGMVVEHAFDAPGEHEARLVVTDSDALTAEATITLDIKQANRPPTAIARVLDAEGKPAIRSRINVPLTFDAAGSSDPDGPITIDWDFGDGLVSHATRATHAYETAGVHVARLVVRDGIGASSEAVLRIPIDAMYPGAGEVSVAKETARFEFPVAKDAKRIVATLKFDGALGANDARIVVRDAGDREISRSTGTTGPGGAAQTRAVAIEAAKIGLLGAWAVEVERVSGGTIAWTLEVETTY